MAMAEADDRFAGASEDPDERRRDAERRCLEAEQRCFVAERRRFEAERQRDQVQALLADARRAGLKMEQIVAELRRLVASLREGAARPAPHAGSNGTSLVGETPRTAGREEMVDALTLAIARLRANVEAVGEPETPPSEGHGTSAGEAGAVSTAPAQTLVVAPAAPQGPPPRTLPPRAPHKHSMSWIQRWRMRRKQRR
jgi:hypothetical protein